MHHMTGWKYNVERSEDNSEGNVWHTQGFHTSSTDPIVIVDAYSTC